MEEEVSLDLNQTSEIATKPTETQVHLKLKKDTAQRIAYTCITFSGISVLLGFVGAWLGFSDMALGYLFGLPPIFAFLAVGGKPLNNAGEGLKSWGRNEGRKK